jgi:hypothetical protein
MGWLALCFISSVTKFKQNAMQKWLPEVPNFALAIAQEILQKTCFLHRIT